MTVEQLARLNEWISRKRGEWNHRAPSKFPPPLDWALWENAGRLLDSVPPNTDVEIMILNGHKRVFIDNASRQKDAVADALTESIALCWARMEGYDG